MRLKWIFAMVLMVGIVLLQPIGATRVMAAVSEGCKAVNEVGGPNTEQVGPDEVFDLTTVLKTITNLPFKKGDKITLKWEVTNLTGSVKFKSQGEIAKINNGDPNAGPKDANKVGEGSLTVEVQTKGNASFKAQVIITEAVRQKAWIIRWWLTCTPSALNDNLAPTDEATVTPPAEPTTPTDQPTTEPTIAVPPASPTSQPTAEVTPPPTIAPSTEPTTAPTTEPTPPPPAQPITEAAPVETAQPGE